MIKKLLFLVCVLSVYNIASAMNTVDTKQAIKNMELGKIKDRVENQEWKSLVEGLMDGYLTSSDLAPYTKGDLDKPDKDNRTLFQHLIFQGRLLNLPAQKTALAKALQELVKADKITHSQQLAETAYPTGWLQTANGKSRMIEYYQNTIGAPASLIHKYFIGVALLTVAGLLAYKYWSAPSQDEDGETETEENEAAEPKVQEAK